MAYQITHWLLAVLVLSLGLGQLMRLEIWDLPIFVHDLFVLAVLLLQVRNLKVPLPAGLKLFLLGLTLGWLRALTLYPLTALAAPALYSLRLLAYLALYLQINRLRLRLPAWLWLTSGTLALCAGLLQYFLLPDLRIFQYLGWDDHLNRLTLPHFDPTFAAAALSLYALLIPRAWWRLLGFVGILLSYSRSVWLSLALTGSYFAIKHKKFSLLIIGACLMLIASSLLPQRFGEGNNLLRTFSITSRIVHDWSYLAAYSGDLILGRGLNTLVLDSPPGEFPSHVSGPNNSYLYLLLTTGILGLAGWLVFLHHLYQTTSYKPVILFTALASLFNNMMFYPFTLLLLLLSSTVPSATLPSSLSRSRRGRPPLPPPPGPRQRAGKAR